jgi:hypothetical protein
MTVYDNLQTQQTRAVQVPCIPWRYSLTASPSKRLPVKSMGYYGKSLISDLGHFFKLRLRSTEEKKKKINSKEPSFSLLFSSFFFMKYCDILFSRQDLKMVPELMEIMV